MCTATGLHGQCAPAEHVALLLPRQDGGALQVGHPARVHDPDRSPCHQGNVREVNTAHERRCTMPG